MRDDGLLRTMALTFLFLLGLSALFPNACGGPRDQLLSLTFTHAATTADAAVEISASLPGALEPIEPHAVRPGADATPVP